MRLLLLLGLFVVSSASAQNPLRWDQDTVTIRQRGCVITSDTLRATFRNVSNAPAELLDLFGLGNRWTILNRNEALRSIAPGEAVELILYFNGGPSPTTSNEKLTLRTSEGVSDTLRVTTAIYTAGLGTKYHDTISFDDYAFPLGTTSTWIINLDRSGNLPFVFEDFWVKGDSELAFIRPFLRDTLVGIQRIYIMFTPDSPGTFEATAFMRGTECDSIYTITAIFASNARLAGKVHWDSYAVNLVPDDCKTPISEEVVLMNTGTLNAEIDSVEIIDDPNNSFSIISSDPPGRMSYFVLSPGPWDAGIKYKILFDPKGVPKKSYAKLVVRVQGDQNDTIILNGAVQTGVLSEDTLSTKLGKMPIETERTIHPLIANTGGRDFLITSIDIPTDVQVTLSRLAVDTVIRSSSYHRFDVTVRSSIPGPISIPITLHGTSCDEPMTFLLTGEVLGPQSVRNQTESGIEITQEGRAVYIRHRSESPLFYQLKDLLGRTVTSGNVRSGEQIKFSPDLNGAYFLLVGSGPESALAKMLF